MGEENASNRLPNSFKSWGSSDYRGLYYLELKVSEYVVSSYVILINLY